MIGPEHERVQGADDVFCVHLWDAAGKRFVAVRTTGPADSSATSAVIVEQGAAREAASASVVTEAPLERWRVLVDAPDGGRLESELRAVCAPVSTLGGERYVQLCAVSGALDGVGVRAHAWGAATAPQRLRFVSAATPSGEFLTVAAARRVAGVPHGEELIGGHFVDPAAGGEPHPFEEVRLSTIYDSHGQPLQAGLELYRPGAEFPTRASGEAVWSRPGLAFFRWTLSGVPAWGTYQVEQPS